MQAAPPTFISGLVLSSEFHAEVVGPILGRDFPNLPYAAALLGAGSETLGLDTPASTDHQWGPRLILFLKEGDLDAARPLVHEALRRKLPVRFRGYSTHFGVGDPNDHGVRKATYVETGPVDHLIEIHSIPAFWQTTLGIDPYGELTATDWLTFSEHGLLTLTAGGVFHDDVGLEEVRRRFAYYPHDVWLYQMAAQWMLIAQEEPFVGRAASVDDAMGSRVLLGRIVERLMRLCFLIERRYAPYSKWFGSAFRRLACFAQIGPLLEKALAAHSYEECEPFLAEAYVVVANMHNALGMTAPLEACTRTYSGWHLLRRMNVEVSRGDPRNTRPHQVIFAERFADAICAAVRDPDVLSLVPHLGSVNQFLVSSSEALQNVSFSRRLRSQMQREGPVHRGRHEAAEDIAVRRVTPADAAGLVELLQRLDTETAFMMCEPGERTATANDQAKRISSILATDNQMAFVAARGDDLVGVLFALGGTWRRNHRSVHVVVGVAQDCWGEGHA